MPALRHSHPELPGQTDQAGSLTPGFGTSVKSLAERTAIALLLAVSGYLVLISFTSDNTNW
jgi:hypothetical protein